MMDEYNDYEEQTEMETNNPEYLEMVKDHLARSNWQAIKEKGIDPTYYEDTDRIETLKEIIVETINYFEDIEEYEKCADLKKAYDAL